jgi:hypothetical protein
MVLVEEAVDTKEAVAVALVALEVAVEAVLTINLVELARQVKDFQAVLVFKVHTLITEAQEVQVYLLQLQDLQ